MEGPPPKQQQQPSGSEAEMKPRPVALDVRHKGSGKLRNKARNTMCVFRTTFAWRFASSC